MHLHVAIESVTCKLCPYDQMMSMNLNVQISVLVIPFFFSLPHEMSACIHKSTDYPNDKYDDIIRWDVNSFNILYSPCESGFILNTFPLLEYCVGVWMRLIFVSLGLNKEVIGYELSWGRKHQTLALCWHFIRTLNSNGRIAYWCYDHNRLIAVIGHCQLQVIQLNLAPNSKQIEPKKKNSLLHSNLIKYEI